MAAPMGPRIVVSRHFVAKRQFFEKISKIEIIFKFCREATLRPLRCAQPGCGCCCRQRPAATVSQSDTGDTFGAKLTKFMINLMIINMIKLIIFFGREAASGVALRHRGW